MLSAYPKPSLARALVIQGRVIRALLLRELITRFGRRNLGVLWLVFEPAMFTLGVATLWSATGGESRYNIPIVAFAVTGYSSVLVWRNTVSHAVGAIHQNLNLLHHRNVRVLDVLIARLLLEVVGATASFALLSLVFSGVGLMDLPRDPLKVVAGWLMLSWFGIALGLTLGAASSMSELVHQIWRPLSYILFPMSGAAFIVTALPTRAQEWVLVLPMVHGVEVLRDGFFGEVIRTRYDLVYMGSINLALTMAGLALVRVAARRVEAE
jgi:capsular polysaccharide transport system permease protein